MKFGGTSVGNAERIKDIVEIVRSQINRKPVVVVSAFSGVTDSLISAANSAVNGNPALEGLKRRHFEVIEGLGIGTSVIWRELEELEILMRDISPLKELTPRTLDTVMSFGERIAAKIIAEYMTKEGLDARAYNSYDIGFVTDSNFGNAEVLPETETNLQKFLRIPEVHIPVVTGFLAKDKNGYITTVGRGGSDYTASIIGSALDAEEIQIWTDVDGILTADPKIVKNARTVDVVSYKEASELAFLGAKVLHPKTILPAIKKNIPVRILNTYNPTHKGTTVLAHVNKKSGITSIACKRNIKIIVIHSPEMFLFHGFLHKIFKIFDEMAISVDFISTSEVSISLTIDGKYDTTKLVEELRKLAAVEVKNNRATVSVIGVLPGNAPVIPGRIYTSFEDKNIDVEMISAGAWKINETIVVKEEDANDAVRILHETLFGE
ncbi:MAG: aspartate kinase [Candidatus Aenigmarchaeota archaeon]|nr:aspartate kinase [Candidatus Aenigmarchaeota archaeon]